MTIELDPIPQVNRFGYPESRDRLTYGSWHTERESCAHLDDFLGRTGLFHVYSEVRGQYLQPKLDQGARTPRIDRILWPTEALLDLGWRIGPIGVECKRSQEKIGPPIAQLMDYKRAAWLVDERVHNWTLLEWLFLWPVESTHGPIASVLAQHRLGTAEIKEHYIDGPTLRLMSGGQLVASVTHDGHVRIGPADHGKKVGSR